MQITFIRKLHDLGLLPVNQVITPLLDDLYFTFEGFDKDLITIADLDSAHISCNMVLNVIEQLKLRLKDGI